MKRRYNSEIKTLGLFEKRFEGDDSLLQLAHRRFLDARMGPEIHGGTAEQIDSVLRFRPGLALPAVVHLPRDFNLVDEGCRLKIIELSRQFAGRIYGFVLHDHESLARREQDYVAAAWSLDDQLERIENCPLVFVEYAAGLALDEFSHFFCDIRDLDHISACLDIGHIGIRYARAAYARNHGGEDICLLKSQGPELPALMEEVSLAVALGAASAIEAIEPIAALNKPIHFHLHDGHPLSTFSPFGVSDHLSFFAQIPLTFEYQGQKMVKPMFGPEGLQRVVSKALSRMEAGGVSFTLEIHPVGERTSLGDAAPLFEHWRDKSNAERMNHWLGVLHQNHVLLRKAIEAALPSVTQKPKSALVAPAESKALPSGTEVISGACEI